MDRVQRRAVLLRDWFGFEFPDELFAFWNWYEGLSEIHRETVHEELGMSPVGICDVLAGRFDGVELRYPIQLHWRFRLDLPEFFTVLSGDTDGLHFGYWFDHPGRLRPVVAASYARDAYEFWTAGDTLFGAVRKHLLERIDANRHNILDDPEQSDAYRGRIERLERLADVLPRVIPLPKREVTIQTPDGMGVVVPPATWDPSSVPSARPRKDLAAVAMQQIGTGKPGVGLYLGKILWPEDHGLACDVLESAYVALEREPLARVVAAHRRHPALPMVSVLHYRRGDYTDFTEALREPERVLQLEVGGEGLDALPDLSTLVELRGLALWGNRLQALPDSLAACSKLESLNLFRNALEVFPPVLGRLPALRTLQLGRNAMTQIGDAIGGCQTLVELDLSHNALESLPEAMGELGALQSLDLSRNGLRCLPDSLGMLSSLRFLGLRHCQLEALPVDLGGWRALERIGLAGNPLPESELERLRVAAPRAEII